MPLKSIPIILGDGKERHLRFDFNSFCALEEEFNISLQELPNKLAGSLDAKTLRAILWAGLIHEDEALTIRQTGALIDIENIGTITDAILKAFNLSSKTEIEPKNGERPEPEKNQNETVIGTGQPIEKKVIE